MSEQQWEVQVFTASSTEEAQASAAEMCWQGWEPVGIAVTATTIRILMKRRVLPPKGVTQ